MAVWSDSCQNKWPKFLWLLVTSEVFCTLRWLLSKSGQTSEGRFLIFPFSLETCYQTVLLWRILTLVPLVADCSAVVPSKMQDIHVQNERNCGPLCWLRQVSVSSGGTVPLILNPGTRWKLVATFMTWPLDSCGKSNRHPLNKRLDGPRSRSESFRGQEYPSAMFGIEPRFLGRPDRSLVTMSTTLVLFLR
jgi:hypothetical protein